MVVQQGTVDMSRSIELGHDRITKILDSSMFQAKRKDKGQFANVVSDAGTRTPTYMHPYSLTVPQGRGSRFLCAIGGNGIFSATTISRQSSAAYDIPYGHLVCVLARCWYNLALMLHRIRLSARNSLRMPGPQLMNGAVTRNVAFERK